MKTIEQDVVYIVYFIGKGFKDVYAVYFNFEKAMKLVEELNTKCSREFHYEVRIALARDSVKVIEE